MPRGETDLSSRRRSGDQDSVERSDRVEHDDFAESDRFPVGVRDELRRDDRDDDDAPAGEARRESAGEGDLEGDGGPRRRRRRGRRGGRRRRGGDREGEATVRSTDRDGDGPRDRAEPRGRSAAPADDDEPLPAGYGVRPAARPETARGDEPRRDDESAGRAGDEPQDEARGEDRDAGKRRRRRRRRGEGRSREAGTTAEGGGSSRRSSDSSGQRRGRRGRRSGDERRSASTLERGRRGEFAPVAGGREEDDEGLEFLGLEDAGHESTARGDRHHEDDESVIESGLNEVLDVPSWVEAIGIVIAGNLDSRSRGTRSGGSSGESSRPADGGRGGDRPRDGRRGGRSGDQR